MNSLDPTQPSGPLEFRRRIRVPALMHEADAITLQAKVGSLPGVRAVVVDLRQRWVMVCYDVTKSDYLAVIGALEDSGFTSEDNWFSRRKKEWYGFTETNAKDNAKAPPPACCNKPPK